MKLGILHISDIHFDEVGKDVGILAGAIKSAVQPRCSNLSTLLVTISGDVANSGKSAEYDRARQFLESLLQSIGPTEDLTVLGPVLVPGNHDCDFDHEGDVRPDLLTTLAKKLENLDLSGQTVQQLTKVQDEFFSFEQGYSGVNRPSNERLYYASSFDTTEGRILIHCFNTAWASRRKEPHGQLLFPAQVKPLIPAGLPILNLTVFHHPLAWFENNNGRKFRSLIESISDIVLTGHEHDGDAYAREAASGSRVNYVEGAPLRAPGLPSAFNFVTVDTERKRYEVTPFVKKGDIYEPAEIWDALFVRNPNLVMQYFEHNSTFQRVFTQLGGAFTHPVKQALEINDLFVYPDIRTRGPADKQDKLISSQNVFDYVTSQKHLNISGGALSGKTTLARKLCLDLQANANYVPLFLSGTDLKGEASRSLAISAKRAFSDQYSSERFEAFQQLDRGRKALVIDDWHLAKLNSKSKAQLLAVAQKEFEIVITLSIDGSWLQDLLESGSMEHVSDFHHCDIKEFGYKLRSQIITKWHTLGREFELEEAQIFQSISTSEHLLDNIIGKGVVPSHPVFILYALQVSEIKTQSTITHGSYGHVYEALLTARLAEGSSKASDIGTKYTYLSLIAYRLFQEGKKFLNPSELLEVHALFRHDYDMPRDHDRMINELEDANILGRSGEDVGFLHKYCYYFFVAKYFQKALANESETATVTNLLNDIADMIHDSEYMNILIFYIYLTEDRRIIERIITNAKLVFAEHAPCDLKYDVEFLGDLWKPVRLQLNSGSIAAHREKYRERQDADARSLPTESTDLERTKYDRTLRDSIKVDFANGLLQVMGQVLRNFPGDLKADVKFQLTNESYQLSLRTLKAVLVDLQAVAPEVRSVIEKSLLAHRPYSSADEASSDAGRVLAFFAQVAIYGTIKKVSSAVGIEDLRETYAAVRKAAGALQLPFSLIDLSIRLDHFPLLPMSDIEELAAIPDSEIVPHTILRLLVADHLYLFPLNYKDRQKLASLLGLGVKQSLLTDKKIKDR